MSNERDYYFGGPDAEIDVVFQPAPGHTDAELVARLEEEGASEVAVLTPGYVSARVARRALKTLEGIAVAHPKATKRPHIG